MHKEKSLISDSRGTATIEYLVVLVGVTLGASAAIIGIGPSLVALFHVRVMWLALPIP